MAISGFFVAFVALGVVPIVMIGALADAPGRPDPAASWAALGVWLLVCLVVAFIDFALAARPSLVSLQRELPERVRLGETVPARLTLRNQQSRTLRAVVRDGWQPSAGLAGINRARVLIAPQSATTLMQSLTPTRRGDRSSEFVTIRSYGPLRFAARQANRVAPARLRVLPPFHSRRHLASKITKMREIDGRNPLIHRGAGSEFDSLREYVRGDDVRSIDWRATARAGDLVVRTWRPERDRRIMIVLDSSRTSAMRISDEPRIDSSFEASLLLAALATRAGDHVDFLAWDRRVRGRVQGASGAQLMASMVDAMATIDPALVEIDWRSVPGVVRGVSSRRSLIVLLTSIDSVGSARGLLAMLPSLTRNHTVLVAAATEAVDLATAPVTSDDAYERGSEDRATLERSRVMAAIRRLGADVVTAAPHELPPALADHYLALKAAGRL